MIRQKKKQEKHVEPAEHAELHWRGSDGWRQRRRERNEN